MIRLTLIFALTSLFGCSSLRQEYQRKLDYQPLNAVTTSELQTFANEAELRRYIKQLERIQKRAWAQFSRQPAENLLAQNDESCGPEEECSEELDSIAVTGSRIAAVSTTTSSQSTASTITNNQSAGVDEGDVVKQIGDYLLTLQDGRIFVINAKSFKLTDRIDVYPPQDAKARARSEQWQKFVGADWYDEMLVHKQFVITIAYSYEDEASEISIFALNEQSGTLSRRSTHLVPSWDYYSSSNYASRLVGDSLVLNTNVDLSGVEDLTGAVKQVFPRNTAQNKRHALLPASSIYKPLLQVLEPHLHQITRCDLATLANGADVSCHAFGFIGPKTKEFYVSPDHIYLWLTSGDYWNNALNCQELGFQVNAAIPARAVPLAAVYRISLNDSAISVASARGLPADQFHLDDYQHQLRALVSWYHSACYFKQDVEVEQKRFLSISNSEFGQRFEKPASRFVPLPSIRGTTKARFIDEWLVYGASNEGSPPALGQDRRVLTQAFVFNQDRPKDIQRIALDHDGIRLERIGQRALLTGYLDDRGLRMSVLNLSEPQAAIEASLLLEHRFESEGRSHAFNFTETPEGLVMGLPTVARPENATRWYWYSDDSDLSYLELKHSKLTSLGFVPTRSAPEETESTQKDFEQRYQCEVSCIDWYGNARPIFSALGWFGLMGTEMVQVERAGDAIRVARRLDMTQDIGN